MEVQNLICEKDEERVKYLDVVLICMSIFYFDARKEEENGISYKNE